VLHLIICNWIIERKIPPWDLYVLLHQQQHISWFDPSTKCLYFIHIFLSQGIYLTTQSQCCNLTGYYPTLLFVVHFNIKFRASEFSTCEDCLLPPRWDPQAAVWFFVQCILFQHLTSVNCIKWSVFIYLCIFNNCLLWHQCSQLYKNKVWWTSTLNTLMYSKLYYLQED